MVTHRTKASGSRAEGKSALYWVHSPRPSTSEQQPELSAEGRETSLPHLSCPIGCSQFARVAPQIFWRVLRRQEVLWRPRGGPAVPRRRVQRAHEGKTPTWRGKTSAHGGKPCCTRETPPRIRRRAGSHSMHACLRAKLDGLRLISRAAEQCRPPLPGQAVPSRRLGSARSRRAPGVSWAQSGTACTGSVAARRKGGVP
jgi:hypothetical protein